MSGYDGEGTGVDFGGSTNVVDADPTGAPGTPPGGTGTPGIDPVALGLDAGLMGKTIESVDVNWGQLARNTLTGLMAAFGLVNPTFAGKVSGGTGLLNFANAPSAFGKSYSYEFSSKAPDLFGGAPGSSSRAGGIAGSAAPSGPSSAPGFSGYDGDTWGGSPVLADSGAFANVPRPGMFMPGPGAVLRAAQPQRYQTTTSRPSPTSSSAAALVIAGLTALLIGN